LVVSDNIGLNYDEPIEIAPGIYWIGFLDMEHDLNCNPYLIVEEKEAIVVDGGSRTDFSTVMIKILQTGVNPSKIVKLLYHHYDPDLCGSIPDFEKIIKNKDLSIISHQENNYFIRYYGGSLERECVEKDLNLEWEFSTGRKLKFILTPYAHAPGNFFTFDKKTGTLFTSDIFGSYYRTEDWELFLELDQTCQECEYSKNCPEEIDKCPILEIINFHKDLMPNKKALKYALKQIEDQPIKKIAPQHGSVISNSSSIEFIIKKLKSINKVGIDKYL